MATTAHCSLSKWDTLYTSSPNFNLAKIISFPSLLPVSASYKETIRPVHFNIFI